MKRIPCSKLAGATTVLVGLSWFGFMGMGPFRVLRGEATVSHLFLYIGFYLLLWTPALLCIFFGIRLLVKTTKGSIKGTMGSLMTVLVVNFGPRIDRHMPDRIAESTGPAISLFIATLVAIPIYAVLCRAVMRREGIPAKGYREFISKTVIVLVALQLWGIGTNLVIAYGEPTAKSPSEVPNTLLLGFFPILIAWGFYRVAVWFVERGRAARPDPITS